MTAATVIGVPIRWKWEPVEHCDSCGEAHPVDHACPIRLETAR